MIYLMTEISFFLLAAFATGWWLGRRQARATARARVIDVALPTAQRVGAERPAVRSGRETI